MKHRFDLIDPKFLLHMAEVLTHGRQKYPDQDLKDTPFDDNIQSILRHANELHRGEYINHKDWGLPVEAHIAVRAMMSFLIRTKNEK